MKHNGAQWEGSTMEHKGACAVPVSETCLITATNPNLLRAGMGVQRRQGALSL
jgi:hypothetical protein